MSNYISATLSEENQKRAMEVIAELKNLFGFCIKLSPDQRVTLPKVDDVRLPFVEKGIEFGKQEPKIVPPYTNLDEFSKDLKLFRDLSTIERELSSLAEMVMDTHMAAGSDAYQASLSIYQSAKGASKMGIPETQSIEDQMKILFDGQGNFKEVKP